MTITEMPGETNQVMRISRSDLEQRLGRGDHFDQASVLEHQRIAAAQGGGVLQVEQELKAARAGHRHPPPVAIVKVEHDGVGRALGPAMMRLDLSGADHTESLSTLASLMISITVGEAFSGADSSRQTFMCGALPCAPRSSRVSQRSTTT